MMRQCCGGVSHSRCAQVFSIFSIHRIIWYQEKNKHMILIVFLMIQQ